ncbi:MAG: PAS domain S-box protein [Candidatus Thorarchaeota archaeon]
MITDEKDYENLETQLQLFMDTVDDLIFIIETSDELRLEYVNKCSFLYKLGYSSVDLIGEPFLSIIAPEDIKKAIKVLKKGAELPDRIQELRLKNSKGELIWVELKSKKFKLENGSKKYFVIIKDISRRKNLEEQLRLNEERFKKITETIPEIRFWKLFNPKKYEEALQSSYEMLEMVMENIPQYIFWKDIELNYQGCNDNYAKLIGIDHPENIINKKDEDLPWTQRDIDSFQQSEKGVIKSGKPELHIIDSWILNNGNEVWFDINRIPLYDSEGKVVGVLVSFEDVTERILAEQNLKESEEKYRHLIESSPYSILLFDRQGIIVDYNSTTEKLFGYSKDDFIGRSYEELPLAPIEIYSILNKKLLKLYKGEIIESTEFQVYRKNGTIAWVNTELTLIKLSDRTYFQAIVQDITDKKETEAKYRDLLETSTVGILEIDLINRSLTYINPKLLEIIGYKNIEAVNRDLLDKIIHPDDIEKIFKATKEKDLEFRIFSKDEKIKWLQGKRTNQFDDKGKLISFRMWLEDVSEKKMYEKLIYELNIDFLSFSADIQNNIVSLLKTCNKLINGTLALYINRSRSEEEVQYKVLSSKGEIFNYSNKGLRNDPFIFELFRERHDFPQTSYSIDETDYAKTDEIIKKNKIKASYSKLIKSGEEFNDALCVLYKTNPILTNQDKLVLFLISDAIEIEKRRWEVQQHLEEQNKMLSEINKLKTDLLSRTSHELKTPLISIKGFTELLLNLHKSKLDGEVISILEEIKEGSKRLENYINSIVESSQLDQGLLKLNKSKEDLSTLIKYCVEQLQGTAELRKQKIEMKINKNLSTFFDKERIYEVVSNLLINAIKYTPLNGNIEIKTAKKSNFYIISIKDDGIGITETEKKQLFKQFGKIERYGQGWDVGIEGTGLGLYISKEIVELHGGKIWVESEGRNRGSTFYFSLPVL